MQRTRPMTQQRVYGMGFIMVVLVPRIRAILRHFPVKVPSPSSATRRYRAPGAVLISALSLTEDRVLKSRVIPRDVILGSKIVIPGSKIAIFGSI